MSLPYNPRAIVEKTPNALLQKFFSRFPAFSDLDWKNLAENDAEPVLQCLKKLDQADQRLIGVKLRQVHALGDSPGTTAGPMRRYVVVGVNRESRHNRSPLRRALRGHDIHHSVWEHKQENCEKNRRGRRTGDAGPQIASDCAK